MNNHYFLESGADELPDLSDVLLACELTPMTRSDPQTLPDLPSITRQLFARRAEYDSGILPTAWISSPATANELDRIGLPKLDAIDCLVLPPLPRAIAAKADRGKPAEIKNDLEAELTSKPQDEVLEEFSAIAYYGCDAGVYKRILAATATVLAKLPSQRATDIIMDMPAWQRDDFLATQNVSPLIIAMLDARLEDSPIKSWPYRDQETEMRLAAATPDLRHAVFLDKLPIRSGTDPLDRLTISRAKVPPPMKRKGIAILNEAKDLPGDDNQSLA